MDDATALHRLSHPIAECPVKPGEPYGPLLLIPGRDGRELGYGEWDGWRYIDLDHGDLIPTRYLYLGRSEA